MCTRTHKQMSTQAHKHTNMQTYRQTFTNTDTQSHIHTHTRVRRLRLWDKVSYSPQLVTACMQAKQWVYPNRNRNRYAPF